jgi:hypothetical protein
MMKTICFMLLLLSLLSSCEQTKDPIFDVIITAENYNPDQKNEKIIEYHCCYNFENVQVNGEDIFGDNISDLMNTFENMEFESILFGGSCGIQAFNDNRPEIISGFRSDFLTVGLKEDIEKEVYFIFHIDVTALLNNHFSLALNGNKYDIYYQPTIFEVIEAWNLEVKNYKLDELVIQNETKDYGLKFIFDEYNVLKEIALWGKC